MSDHKEHLDKMLECLTPNQNVYYAAIMSAPIIYAVLLIVTTRKFGFSLLCTYKLPLLSWIVEYLLNITAGILYFSNSSE